MVFLVLIIFYSVDSTHTCQSPTPTMNICDVTPLTWTQSSEQVVQWLDESVKHVKNFLKAKNFMPVPMGIAKKHYI